VSNALPHALNCVTQPHSVATVDGGEAVGCAGRLPAKCAAIGNFHSDA